MKQLLDLIEVKKLISPYYRYDIHESATQRWKRTSYKQGFMDLGRLSVFCNKENIKSSKDIIVEQFINNKIMIPDCSEYITVESASKFYFPGLADLNITFPTLTEEFYNKLPKDKKFVFYYFVILKGFYSNILENFTIKQFIRDINMFLYYLESEFKDKLLSNGDLKKDIKKAVVLYITNVLKNNFIEFPEKFPYLLTPTYYSSSEPKKATHVFLNHRIIHENVYKNYTSIYSPHSVERIRIDFNVKLNKVFKKHIMVFRNKMFSFKIKSKLINNISNSRNNFLLDIENSYEISPHELYVALVIRREKYNDFILSRLRGETDVNGYFTLLVDERFKTPTTAKNVGLNGIRSRYILKLLSLFKGAGQEIVFTNNLINKLYEKII
jgi:hypothetical protein